MTNAMKAKMEKFLAIYRRAEKLSITSLPQYTHMMDLDAADRRFNMRLDDWLSADTFNFSYDFLGIMRHFNRSTGKFDGQFKPRFARKC